MKKNQTDEQTTLTDNDEAEILERLSARVEKAVSTIQELRRERDELRTRVDELESRVRDSDETSNRLSSLEEEHDRFRKERGEIRNRIETILGSLEALESAD
ncbi:MAG TPA: cell division protein ZapB [Thermoanaerobaculia bacterium]|nr:cell division protein ZapB [Thermoanaerobaculia bacterium]